MAQDKTGDFESWLKGQEPKAEPKPAKSAGGDFESWLKGKPAQSQPRQSSTARRLGLKPAEGTSFDLRGGASSRINRAQQPSAPPEPTITPNSTTGPLAESLRDMDRRGFEKKPAGERFSERVYDALARSGGQLSRMVRQPIEAGMGLAKGLNSGDFSPVRLEGWRKYEQERNAELETRKQSRPSSFATDVGEGIIEASGPAAVAYLLSAAGVPAALAGAGISAAGADWRDPGRAAVQTAIGTAGPVIGGKLGSKIGAAVAGRLANPVSQAAARVGGELLGGGAGNALGSAAEQLASEGKLNPRELAKSAVIGAALAAPGAAAAARRPLTAPAPKVARYRTDEGAIVAPESPLANRRLLPPANQDQIPTARLPVPPPRGIPLPASTQELVPETFGRISPRKLLSAGNPEEVPTALLPQPTQPIPIADAPVTREMPSFKEWLAAENAPTAEMPRVPTGETERRITAEMPREVAPVTEKPETGLNSLQFQQVKPIFGGDRPLSETVPQRRTAALLAQEPTNRITSGAGDELPSYAPRPVEGQPVELPGRTKTERLPVPKVTAENRETLVRRAEELRKLAESRRGEFLVDLRDELSQLNAAIRDYDVKNSPRQIGEPPGMRPEALPNPQERSARRAALESKPRESGLLQSSTPGQRVARESQMLPGSDPRTAFKSREDARQGHFDTLTDDELIGAIRDMREIENQKIRGKSRLTPEQLEANRFDLQIAKKMQSNRRRIQTRQGRDLADIIPPLTPSKGPARGAEKARTVTHPDKNINGKAVIAETRDGRVIVANPENKSGVSVVRDRSTGPIPEAAMPELTAPNAPPSPLKGKAITAKAGSRQGYTIPAEAAPDLSRTLRRPDRLARAVGRSASDETKIAVADLGLESKTAPSRSADAKAVKRNISIDDITLGRDDLSKGRMFQVKEALKGGVKPEKKGVRLAEQIEPIVVVPDPAKPGKWIVSDDGNHRIALLKLQGFKGNVPTTAYETPKRGHIMGAGLGVFGGGGKLPSRAEVAETVGGVQAVSQLGNPRFVIRNVLQHVAFGKQERAATRLAAVVDWAYSKATGKGRQIASPTGSDLASYVRNWQKAVAAHKAGQALPGGSSPMAPTANANKIDKAVGKLMTYMNEIPDAANWQTRFEDSLQSIVNAAKRSGSQVDMASAISQAKLEADRASLRDKNFAADSLQKIKEGLNKASSPIFGTDKFGVGDFVLKYAKTPGALLKRGLERSPLGLFQVAKEAATPGPYRRRNTLLALSRVAEGAATGVGLGAGLAAAGVLVGPEEENKTGKAFEREEGVKGYSLNASALRRLLTGESPSIQSGDTLYSIDWLQPWAMNLSTGAALWGLHKNGKLGGTSGAKATGEAIYNSLSKTLDVMGDQSVLKNLSRYMDKATGDDFSDKAYNFMKSIGLDVPSSFVPSLARQARQVADPFERDTRPESRRGVAGFAREAASRALSQIPGVSESFPKRPSLLTGEDRKTSLGEMGIGGRIAAQFSPSNVSSYTPRPVAREISRLNQAGEKVVVNFPAPTTNKRTGEREPTSSLRGRERSFAEAWSRMSQEMIQDPTYKDSDNQTKAAAFAGLKQHLSRLGKEDFEEKGIDEIIEAAIETVEKRKEKEEK